MTTIAPLVPFSQYDRNARFMLNSLKAGKQPEEYLDCGRWNVVVGMAQDAFNTATVKNGAYQGSLVHALLNSMIKSKKYSGLEEILSDIEAPRIEETPPPSLHLVEQPPVTPALEITSKGTIVPLLPDGIAFSPDISKGACPLRDEYVRYSEILSPEGYKEFHEGSFWAMLSTIAARRIYAEFSKPLYTPLYIILTARTSLYAKSVTAEVMRDVLTAAGLDWILGADRTTPQKLMSDMAGKYIPDDYKNLLFDEQEILKLRLAMSGQVGWINDEFGKFVKGMLRNSSVMSDFADLFLTFDNCPKKYRNTTIARSSEPIYNPYLSVLGCMTFASIRDNAKAGAEFWGDGFWARFSFITPPPGTHKDAPFTRGQKPVPALLSTTLREWHHRLGTPEIDIVEIIDAKGKNTGKYEKKIIKEWQETRIAVSDAAYDAWVRYRSALKSMIAQFPNEDLDGSYDRLPIKAIRIATLAASLQGCTQIELRHWALAQEVAESWRSSLHQMYDQVNTQHSNTQSIEDQMIEHLQSVGKRTTIREIRQYACSTIRQMKTDAVRGMLVDLERSGIVSSKREGKTEYFELVTQV